MEIDLCQWFPWQQKSGFLSALLGLLTILYSSLSSLDQTLNNSGGVVVSTGAQHSLLKFDPEKWIYQCQSWTNLRHFDAKFWGDTWGQPAEYRRLSHC